MKVYPEFLCGTEFHDVSSDLRFFARHGLSIEVVEVDIALRPGDLLIFDGLARPTVVAELDNQASFITRLRLPAPCRLRPVRLRDDVLSAFAAMSIP